MRRSRCCGAMPDGRIIGRDPDRRKPRRSTWSLALIRRHSHAVRQAGITSSEPLVPESRPRPVALRLHTRIVQLRRPASIESGAGRGQTDGISERSAMSCLQKKEHIGIFQELTVPNSLPPAERRASTAVLDADGRTGQFIEWARQVALRWLKKGVFAPVRTSRAEGEGDNYEIRMVHRLELRFGARWHLFNLESAGPRSGRR